MSPFSYTVAAEFDDPSVGREWVAWLHAEHLAEVLAGGALDAEIIEIDSTERIGCLFEVRYRFASREAFAAYERDHAPALRSKGLARFPASRGVALTRRSGIVLTRALVPPHQGHR